MIKLLTENSVFPDFDDGIFTLRQRAFYNSYGTFASFFMTWAQTDESGKITAVITSLSGDVTLSLSDEADFEEIRQFLFATGFSSIFLNKKYARFFPSDRFDDGKIMELHKALPYKELTFDEPDYKAVYGLVFNENEISFSDWFTDISFRVRRNTAYIHAFKDGENTVACALCSALDGKSALIGSVSTKEDYRFKGIGTSLVTELCAFLQKKDLSVFLCRENNKNKDFYSRIGFDDCGEWMSIKNE